MSLRKSRVRLCALLPIITLVSLGVRAPASAQGGTPTANPKCGGHPATIVGTQNGDSIDGTVEDDVIVGLGGNDVIHGLGGNDVTCAGPGDDIAYGGSGTDGFKGEGGNDVLRGGPGTDGGFSGGPGNDRLYGETGGRNDYIPGSGDDLIVGSGTGTDWVHLEEAPRSIHANLVTGIATGQGTDTFVDVSGLFGGPFADTLIGNDGNNQLAGRAGDDTLTGHGGNDTLSGQQGDDVYRGGPGFDVAEYFDQAAADGLEIGPMNVNLRTGIATGDGTDTLSNIEGATGSDKADTMIGDRKANAFFWLFGGFDTVRTAGGNDFVESSAGPNALSGGAGRDLLAYLDGADFEHQHVAVTVHLGAGTSSSGDTLSGFEDVLGSPHNDTLVGDNGPNRFYGYIGDDVLKGRAGDDRLIGGRGTDEANGGSGMDRCRAEIQEGCESVSRRDGGPVLPYPWRHLVELGRSGSGLVG
jgi:Ca2+-binding RTX toxin-like protein